MASSLGDSPSREEALLDKLEELEDVEDLKTLLCEPTRPLSEILKDLKLDGKL